MSSKPEFYLPRVFQGFQGYKVVDIKDYHLESRSELILSKKKDHRPICHRCGCGLGHQKGRTRLRVKHLKMMGWSVELVLWREKRWCPSCQKVRSEKVEFICPSCPHMSMELAWWLNRLSEVTSVLSVSRLESIDKMSCYRVDKYILTRLLQGYRIPKVRRISVDEVYARGPKQKKDGETRDDLFLTVVVDLKTRKVIWVSQSRRKEALDQFFKLIGEKSCEQIEVVACDQHNGYAGSVREHCPRAKIVWDRFHLVQRFNEAMDDERKSELQKMGRSHELRSYLQGNHRYRFLTKASQRSPGDQRLMSVIFEKNAYFAKLEMIKEHFLKVFDTEDAQEAREMIAEIIVWATDIGAKYILHWVKSIRDHAYFWNYWKCRVTTSLSEGINRVIKGLKWQAYGYKDMFYFSLKILQKAGYLNHRYHLKNLPQT